MEIIVNGGDCMSEAYLCPNCKSNRSRFNLIQQVPQAVKMDPQSGEIIQEFSQENLDPFHTAYNGPGKKVQCGACGLIENEQSFIKFAKLKSERN